MTYQVALLNFEGPLDLLLQLVERSSLPITEVSLAALTEQYIAHIGLLDGLDPVEASQFTDLATRLLYIKSAGLLPIVDNSDEAEAIAELQQQLEEYGTYRAAAIELQRLLANASYAARRQAPTLPQEPAVPPNLTLRALQQTFETALAQQSRQTRHHAITRPKISLADMTQRLLHAGKASSRPTSLQQFFQNLSSRAEIIVGFLAALELWKQGKLQLTQRGQSTIIQIEYANSRPTA